MRVVDGNRIENAGFDGTSAARSGCISLRGGSYLLSTVDALIILSAGLLGCFAYHWMASTPIPDLSAYFALGLFASFIHVARLSGEGYYEFESAAKPSVEIAEVTVAWLGTALLLAFFAFLFKIGGRSREALS